MLDQDIGHNQGLSHWDAKSKRPLDPIHKTNERSSLLHDPQRGKHGEVEMTGFKDIKDEMREI